MGYFRPGEGGKTSKNQIRFTSLLFAGFFKYLRKTNVFEL